MTRHWQTDAHTTPLMPGSKEHDLFVVLFLSQPSLHPDVVNRFLSLALPTDTIRAVVDADGAKNTVRWFGITQTPALTAIHDGTLLAIDHGCDEGVCERLVAFATKQRQMLAAVDAKALGGER